MPGLPRQTPWHEMVSKFHSLGWDGPHYGGPHPVMKKGKTRQPIPNDHGPVHVSLLKDVLRKAGITNAEWFAA